MILSRILAAAIGLAIPLAMAGAADAATAHRRTTHHPARVSTATYKVTPHKPRAHRYRASTPTRGSVAQAPRHAITRGS